MDKRELQELLSQSYKQENWKKIVQFVFPNVSIYSIPKVHPIRQKDEDILKSFKELGTVRLNDGKNLALFEVLLNDKPNLKINRVRLNEVVSSYIDQQQAHGVLSVFEQGGDDFRFTFSARSTEFDMEEGDFVKQETDKKRYTYVLGRNESCKTPAERFFKLSEKKHDVDINAIQNAFSVESLSKEFFDKYKKQFEKFWKYIHTNEAYNNIIFGSDREKGIRDFTKKLLGRIVFLHFLQKKGWMGCTAGIDEWEDGDKQFMQTLFENYSNQSEFHSKCLAELFYNTLNKKRNGDLFSCDGLTGALNNSKVPYLNGGLFDSDEDITRKIDFPETYFQELLDFFGQYNFTIDENDPNDHEVGIDPEMLGHIFENLLEDNKDKGAFYTPKVIVQYMCQESIIEYINSKINGGENIDVKNAVEDLISNKLAEKCSDLDLVQSISKALLEVKICDPAIGSGAFPMGILNVIYSAVEELYFIQPDSVATIWNISDTEWQPHLVKKNIIQHSIYGVDLESGAVDIARLRFWLALVVDEIEPLPLPNLDYKIMQGNSLLESFEGIDLSQISDSTAYEEVYESDQIDMFSGEAKKSVSISLNFEDIETLMDEYFNANDPDTKKEIHKKIDDQVLNHIRFTILQHKQNLIVKKLPLERKLKLEEASASSWQLKEKIRTKSKQAKELAKINANLELFNEKEIKLAQLSNSNERPFFLWNLFFKEVFDEGGFDIVIANPPYVGVKGNTNTFNIIKTGEYAKFSKGRAELFYYFFHLAIKILKKGGASCFITTNYFPTATDANLLRKDLKENSTLLKFLNFNDLKIFNTAPGQHNAITIFKKGKNLSKNLKSLDSYAKGMITSSLFSRIINHEDSNTFYYDVSQDEIFDGEEDYIRFKGVYGGNEILKSIFQKFEKCKTLDLYADIRQGLRTGIDKISDSHIKKLKIQNKKNEGVFILSKKEIELKNLSNSIILKKLYKNSDINHYNIRENSTQFILYITKDIDVELLKSEHPAVLNHLLPYKEVISKIRGKNNENIQDWFTLDRPREKWVFESEKLVVPQRSKSNKFGYSNSDFYASADVYYIVPKSEKLTAKYLTILLNSKLYFFWYYNRGKRKGEMLELYQKPLSETKIFLSKNLNVFDNYFDEITSLMNKGQNIEDLQSKIDLLIYKEFGFSYDEILVIDKEFSNKYSEVFYDKYSL